MGWSSAVAVVFVVLRSVLPAPWPAATDVDAETPFTLTAAGGIVVPVTVNGRGPFRFLIDTGSTHSVITADLANALGAAVVAKAVVASATASDVLPVVALEQVDLGPASVRLLPSVVREMPVPGEAQGLIGQDLLGPRRYTLDFTRRTIVWHRPGCHQGTETGARVALIATSGRFVAHLPQQDGALRLVPDSGSQQLVLFERTGRTLAGLERRTGAIRMRMLHGAADASVASVRALVVGSIVLRDLPATVIPYPGVHPDDADGLLPMHLFDRVTFDGPGGVLVLERRPVPAKGAS
jgi:predicted aspartyl protease